LKAARNVRSIDEPHLAPWLTDWATCEAMPALFPFIDRRCDSFLKWWKHALRELNPAVGLLPARDIVRSEP
jgi:deoxyribodipyrimidine photo-lyase